MPIISGQNRKEIIETLRSFGEVVVIAKAEILYAFRREHFPGITTEDVMGEIRKNPKGHSYYQVGDVKITEISEAPDKKLTPDGCLGSCWLCEEKVKDKCPLTLHNKKIKEKNKNKNPAFRIGNGRAKDVLEFVKKEQKSWENKKD